ncbi:uncharacterized protein LOC110187098 isoform X1 [Drosophila serrata]|uniref:uncharacterized protein LOC110187098 isoform X1 n=1 Tax=Drosophila serrata TaxID=7274 RepID=UPI000A1D1DCF|nr:uncharacterized protein LOC110187098 isoform X1 [Drosophila serrata]
MEFDGDSAGSIESFFSRLQSSESSPRNLSQIFEDDLLPMRKESRNLRYQPGGHRPQQPQPSSTTKSGGEVSSASESVAVEHKPSCWKVVFAKVVNIYNDCRPLKRMGLALTMLGDNEAVTMILYKQKTQMMSNTKVKPSGSTIYLQDHYLQFYDDSRKFWSLRFVYQADEEEFIQTMTSNGWPLEQRTSNSEVDVEQNTSRSEGDVEQQLHASSSEEDVKQLSENNMEPRSEQNKDQQNPADRRHSRNIDEHLELPPQPKPRSRNLATFQKESNQRTVVCRHCLCRLGCEDSQPICEQIPEEDVIVTPMSRPIGSTCTNTSMENQCSSANAIVKLQAKQAESPSATLLTKFLDTHSSPGDIAKMKMQNIFDAMQRVSDGGHRKNINDAQYEGTPKPQPRTTSKTEDAEDRLLELEQLLLDAKKENRELVKELKRRDEDLRSFQTSSLTLLEKVLVSNDDLTEKNARLLDTAMGDMKATKQVNCVNCERSAQEIAFLKRKITALELALREYE